MTSKDIKYILKFVNYDETTIHPTPLEGVRLLNENRFIDRDRNRYLFDFNQGFLKIYFCKAVGKENQVNVSGLTMYKDYDIYQGKVYFYMKDETGEPICDYIDFDSIDVISLDKGV